MAATHSSYTYATQLTVLLHSNEQDARSPLNPGTGFADGMSPPAQFVWLQASSSAADAMPVAIAIAMTAKKVQSRSSMLQVCWPLLALN